MKKLIRLKKCKQAYSYEGKFHYLVSYDARSGNNGRYTVFALNADDPVTIGRELDLKTVRDVIARFEAIAPEDWLGEHKTVINVRNRVYSK